MPSRDTSPDLTALATALKDFVEASTWDESRRILEARRDLLLTVEAPLALVRRMRHVDDSDRRGLLATSAHLLIVARESGIDAAWDWLDTRHRAQKAFAAILESLKDAPPAEAAAAIERAMGALPPAQRRYIEETMIEAAEAAEDKERGDKTDETQSVEQAIKALLETNDDAAALDVIERNQSILTNPDAIGVISALAERAHQDHQPGAREFANRADHLVQLLNRVAREGIASVRRGRPSFADISATATTIINPTRVPIPSENDRALVSSLLHSPLLSDTTRRGLQAWIGAPGAQASPDEIAAAYGLFREITRPQP